MQRIAIATNLVVSRKWPWRGNVVRMMPGDRQVSNEEVFCARNRINPSQHPVDRGRVLNSEAGVMIAADVARVFQSLKTAMPDNLLHPKILEPARMEQGRAIACGGHHRSNRGSGDLGAEFGLGVERGVA